MKSKLTSIALFSLILANFCSAQTSKYFIQFADRNNNPYSVSNPAPYLSQRAIDRRLAQGISIQQNDLPVNPDYVDSVISRGAAILSKSKWFNGVTIEADLVTLQSVLSLPFVLQSVHVQRPKPFAPEHEKTETKFDGPQINQDESLPRVSSFDYGASLTQIQIMNGDYLHDSGFHGEGKLIAVLDVGFYQVDVLPAFDSLRNNNQIQATWDFVSNESGVYEDSSHGMSVLSTIGGNLPGQLVGTAPKASFLLLRTEAQATEYLVEEYYWNAGAEFADSAGADIISSSLGYTTFDDPSQNHTYADMNGHTNPSSVAANIAFSKGMLVVVSAGNSGGGSWQYISSPADADSALAIGAVNGAGNYAFFSSTGPSSDGDIKPNVSAVGQGTIIVRRSGSIGPGNGTSFSCPVLAGSAACLWQAFPGSSNKSIFNAIQQSASQHLTPDSLLGYGIPNFMMAELILGTQVIGRSENGTFLTVYPNPFNHDVFLNYYSESDQMISIQIFDAIGKIIHESKMEATGKTYNTSFVFLKDLQSGVYFLEMISAGGKEVRKIIKL